MTARQGCSTAVPRTLPVPAGPLPAGRAHRSPRPLPQMDPAASWDGAEDRHGGGGGRHRRAGHGRQGEPGLDLLAAAALRRSLS